MKRLTPTSNIQAKLYLQNHEHFASYLTALADHRKALLRGESPSTPPMVRPVYTERGQCAAEEGTQGLKARLAEINASDFMKSHGYIASFESALFAWGLTPIEVRHTSCGTVTHYRAFMLERALKAGTLSCAKRECYESLRGVELAKGSVAPSRKGKQAWNKASSQKIMEHIETESGGVLSLVEGCYKDKLSPVVLLVNAPDSLVHECHIVIKNYSNAEYRKKFMKIAQDIESKGKPHHQVSVYKTQEDAMAAAGY